MSKNKRNMFLAFFLLSYLAGGTLGASMVAIDIHTHDVVILVLGFIAVIFPAVAFIGVSSLTKEDEE